MNEKKRDHNRLINEKSPYLLQHAHNPVDWYPWDEEAFRKAREEDRPVFLSIGYSSCHWCHVMERESFDDKEVAQLMNAHFVAIKVDREERPDVDAVYMMACQSMTGSGGWPLTIIMTPDKKPFFAGTYLPKHPWHGNPGLMQLLQIVADAWRDDRKSLLESGDRITQSLTEHTATSHRGILNDKNLEQAYQFLWHSFDDLFGGFSHAPKFPTPHQLSFLLRWWKRSGNQLALDMVTRTLDALRWGGIYDHLEFGFHRYSTDRQWLIPHFEKMLYDQAMLSIAYLEAYQATGQDRYAEIAREIFTYVLRDMTSPEGAFYSSEDADSEGKEGTFYAWTPEEIHKVLGADDGELFCEYYGVSEQGNFESGTSVLSVRQSLEGFAKEKGLSPEKVETLLRTSRQKLLEVRNRRTHPSRDEKILTDWNALMIAALSRGAQILGEPQYARAAQRAADFVLSTMRNSNGSLFHRYKDGEAGIEAFLDDYAFLAWALIELYEATFESRYISNVLSLTEEMLKIFNDEKNGGFFTSSSESEQMIVRTKELFDGAIPSGNSIAALALLRLSHLTMRTDLREAADRLMEAFGAMVSQRPSAFTQFLIALDYSLGPISEIVIAGDPRDDAARLMITEIQKRFLPRAIVIIHPEGEERKAIETIAPFTATQNAIDGRATAYICENYSCKIPATDLDELLRLLDSR